VITVAQQAVRTDVDLRAWVPFLRAHASITRRLNQELVAEHGLTLNDYEVLLFLSRASDRRMRRVDLANSVLLTASGITRLLEGLERAGYVRRRACETDARVVYAELTDEGIAKLRAASRTHLAGIRRLFVDQFDETELDTLASLFGRLAGGQTADEACGVD
jgi:DNA-binding MarR family transcriptional regulator